MMLKETESRSMGARVLGREGWGVRAYKIRSLKSSTFEAREKKVLLALSFVL